MVGVVFIEEAKHTQWSGKLKKCGCVILFPEVCEVTRFKRVGNRENVSPSFGAQLQAFVTYVYGAGHSMVPHFRISTAASTPEKASDGMAWAEDDRVRIPKEVLDRDRELLESVISGEEERKLCFILGPFTQRYDSARRRLHQWYIDDIQAIEERLDKAGRIPYNCFTREQYGKYRMTNEEATEFDRLALKAASFVLVLPGFSFGGGVQNELRYFTNSGKPIIFMVDDSHPEEAVLVEAYVRGLKQVCKYGSVHTRHYSGSEGLRKDVERMLEELRMDEKGFFSGTKSSLEMPSIFRLLKITYEPVRAEQSRGVIG